MVRFELPLQRGDGEIVLSVVADVCHDEWRGHGYEVEVQSATVDGVAFDTDDLTEREQDALRETALENLPDADDGRGDYLRDVAKDEALS